MNINFIKSLLFVSAFVSMIACSDNDSDKRVNVEGSWISYYDNPEFWNLFTFENNASISYLSGDGVKFQGTYIYNNKEELMDINVTNSNDDSMIGEFTCGVTEVNGKLLFDYGEGDTELYSKITPSTKIAGEWRWRSGNEWKKYILKTNGEFDLIDELGNQSRGTYTYHKNDKLLVLKTEYAESGSLGEEMYFASLFKELIVLEEPNGDLYVYENIK